MTGQPFGPLRMNAYTVVPQGFNRTPLLPPTPSDATRMAAFKANDRNGDGRLDKTEYRATLDALGFGSQFESYYAQRDANKDGFISEAEYRGPLLQ